MATVWMTEGVTPKLARFHDCVTVELGHADPDGAFVVVADDELGVVTVAVRVLVVGLEVQRHAV
jgi:hypothetical protein